MKKHVTTGFSLGQRVILKQGMLAPSVLKQYCLEEGREYVIKSVRDTRPHEWGDGDQQITLFRRPDELGSNLFISSDTLVSSLGL